MYELEPIARAICNSNDYTFVSGIGKGSFKETFLIKNERSDEDALKIFKNEHISTGRIEREINAMKICAHPSIANLKDVSTFEFNRKTYLYLVEEYLSGGTLTERLNSGLLAIRDIDIVKLGALLIEAITHIASHNFVHRDIKPDNILFRPDKVTPVIVDFGVVRDLSEYSLTPSWALSGPGTPLFAAPEQLNNEKEFIDWRTDQFSLGIVLSFCIFKHHPYQYQNDSLQDTVDRVARREPLNLYVTHTLSARGFQPLVKMIAPWPAERYRLPDQLIEAWSELR